MVTNMLSILEIKGLVLAVTFVLTLTCIMLPLLFMSCIRQTHDPSRRFRYEKWLSCLSCAAGGVFMGTCILDLFPDVQEQINLLMDHIHVKYTFPFAEFIVVFGFLLVLCIEQIILEYKEDVMLRTTDMQAALLHDSVEERRDIQRQHSIGGISDRPDFTSSMRSERSAISNEIRNYSAGHSSIDNDDSHSVDVDTQNRQQANDQSTFHSSLRMYLLLFALSLHSVFEGLAIGLQDTIDNVVALFLVVIFHKGIIAFSLGLNCVQSQLTFSQIVKSNTFFTITSPFGIACGMAITEMPTTIASAFLSGSLQGIACGTFLYVTFFEVLPHEFNRGGSRVLKLLFVILGFAAVCVLMYLDPNNHNNSN